VVVEVVVVVDVDDEGDGEDEDDWVDDDGGEDEGKGMGAMMEEESDDVAGGLEVEEELGEAVTVGVMMTVAVELIAPERGKPVSLTLCTRLVEVRLTANVYTRVTGYTAPSAWIVGTACISSITSRHLS